MMMRIARTFALVLLAGCATWQAPPPIFAFHDNFWMNLHHFIRAVGRGMPAGTAALSPEERAAWDAGVTFYRKHESDRDLLFDQGMVEIKNELRRFEGKDSLQGAALDPELAATLTRVAPIYRKYWWPHHRETNERWIAAIRPLLAAHGARIRDRIAESYGAAWPSEPIPVDLVPSAGANAAYTTTAPTAITIDSSEPTFAGLAGLEIVFHEASHAWGTRLQRPIVEASSRRHVQTPRQLWHAVLFHNAGEATRRTLEQDGIPGYVEYAAKHDVYEQLCGHGCRERVAAAWDRHLDGAASIGEALDQLVASFATPPGN